MKKYVITYPMDTPDDAPRDQRQVIEAAAQDRDAWVLVLQPFFRELFPSLGIFDEVAREQAHKAVDALLGKEAPKEEGPYYVSVTRTTREGGSVYMEDYATEVAYDVCDALGMNKTDLEELQEILDSANSVNDNAERVKRLEAGLRMIAKGHIAPKTLAQVVLDSPNWEPPEEVG